MGALTTEQQAVENLRCNVMTACSVYPAVLVGVDPEDPTIAVLTGRKAHQVWRIKADQITKIHPLNGVL